MDVLVVDDHPAMRELPELVLDRMGYEIARSAGAAAALTYLRQTRRPTIVVLNSVLPEIDSVELLEVIVSDLRLAYGHAFLLMIDQLDALPGHAHNVLSALGVPLLFKPFDLDTLFEAIAHLAARLSTS